MFNKSQGAIVSRDLRGALPTTILPIPNLDDVVDFNWLADGRLVYIRREDEQRGGDNFWELRIDSNTGNPIGNPRRITNWGGYHSWGLSATADGKVITFVRQTAVREAVHIADIEANGARLASTRRLTLNEYNNEAVTWTPDGKAIIYYSDRNGRGRLFKQAFDSDTEEALFEGAGDVDIGDASISPDGLWIFYMVRPRQLMARPMKGGTAQLVLTIQPHPGLKGWYPRCAVLRQNSASLLSRMKMASQSSSHHLTPLGVVPNSPGLKQNQVPVTTLLCLLTAHALRYLKARRQKSAFSL